MITFHGSDIIIDKPDILHSGKRLDFGCGFYVTTVKFQAERWAKRKSVIHGKDKGIVNIFEYCEKSDFKIKDFGDDLDSWIDFVCECRSGSDAFMDYDVIVKLLMIKYSELWICIRWVSGIKAEQ